MSTRWMRAWPAALAASLVVLLTSVAPALAAFSATTGTAANTFAAGTGFDTGALYTWGDTGEPQLVPTQVATAASWTVTAIGDHYGCGLQTGGSLWCWGSNNYYGSQGVGDNASHYTPVRIGSSTWTQVATGANHTCAVRSDQTLWCWGEGSNGKLGLGTTTNFTTPQQVTSPAATGWASVAAGYQFTCATRTDGTLYCFGQNQVGQTGNGNTTTPQSSPVQVSAPSTTGWAAVSLGYQHVCALRTDQSLYCWGDGGQGRLGVGNGTSYSTPQQVTGTWSSVGLGTDHSCAIKPAGTLWCWGNGGSGRLGLGNTTSYSTPQQVGSATTWRAVSGGNAHTCATRTDNTQWCWGADGFGQLGQGDVVVRTSPAQIGTATTWSVPAVGVYPSQSCTVKTDGTLWCWGDTATVKFLPAQVGTDTTWRSSAAGTQFFCGVKAAGTLWCWGGQNGSGQQGNGTTAVQYLPTQVGSGTTWAQVTAGSYHACAITTDTKLYCWGENGSGQLGIGSTTVSTSPAQVTTPSATGWASVSAGSRDTCAVRTDGTLYCFGQNSVGQLGIGTTTDQSSPAAVTSPAATGWATVANGYQHVCALRTDRSMYCWGDGGGGRTGQGNTTTYFSPRLVTGSGWWVIGSGTDHTCAIKLTGTLWCWGAGGSGRLGLGTMLDTTTPAQVGTLTGWRSVSGGTVQTCGIRLDNTVWCWGGNDKGQLGLGTGYGSQLAPVQLPSLTGRPAVAGPGGGSTGLITY